jgi:hypothetical protein
LGDDALNLKGKDMGIFDFLLKNRDTSGQSSASEIRPRDELMEAVDLVVKLSHPNIHYVSRFRKKLMPAVEHTLKYSDELIVQMPAPVPIAADSWNSSPFVRTTFLDNKEFKNFFSEHKTLNEFFQKTKASRCCALLVMSRKDKKIFGMEMDGEILKRDVLQTTVDFSDHQIVAPAISESETRKELSLRVLALLATHALEDILSLIALKKDMESEKRILEIKLNMRDARVRSRKSFLPDKSDNAGDTSQAHEMLGELDRKIAEARLELDEPEDYLNRITELLYHPEQFLRSEPVRMFVNDMNIVTMKEHQGKVDEIRFAEISTDTGLRKAAVLVYYKKF